jgi:DNA-binding Lrp family transcriptional regulator
MGLIYHEQTYKNQFLGVDRPQRIVDNSAIVWLFMEYLFILECRPLLMKLTRRQEEFIENLIDLSQELNGPIHYSVLADRLGVSPITAYDMLCLLEEKGLVSSEYQVAEGRSGPGRAERLFFPLVQHNQNVGNRRGVIASNDLEWKKIGLERVRDDLAPEKDFPTELLAQVASDELDHIRYCLEVMTVLALHLQAHTRQREFLSHLADILPQNSEISSANLSLLGGFAYGLYAREDQDHEWSRILLEHILQYQKIVARLSPEECDLLADDLTGLFSPLTTDQE